MKIVLQLFPVLLGIVLGCSSPEPGTSSSSSSSTTTGGAEAGHEDAGSSCSTTASDPTPCDDGKGWCNPSAADGGPVECCHGCLVHDGAVYACARVCPLPNTCNGQGFCVIASDGSGR